MINPDVFKAYDVRGIYGTEITEDLFHQLGRAFVAYLGPGRYAIGRDMRLSSPSLTKAFIDGALLQGGMLVDYGLISTDQMYFAVAADQLDGGAQITASHNPGKYNGCKMVRKEAFPLSGESGIKEMKEMIVGGTIPAAPPTRGSISSAQLMDRYIEHVLSFVDEQSIKPFNVVLDAGSGVAGLIAPRLFDRLACKTTRLCFELDGTFKKHEANPLLEENRQDITAEVLTQKADIGIAWDGDADRCFFIDGTGEFIAGDFITALLAEAFLMRTPGQTIIYDVRASYAVKDIVAKYQGKALMNRVGHAFIKGRMREENAVFGGEVTGHYYFKDNFFADNGFIPALMILELMSKKGQSLHELLKPLREKYFISGEINTKVSNMDIAGKKIDELKKRYASGNPYDLDGVSAEYPDWHFNVRQSNTEPLLRLNLEGLTPEIMEQRRDEVLSIIRG
jgi:phosphomannomutase